MDVQRAQEGLIVRARTECLDAAVIALAAAGIPVRGLQREGSALEPMFFQLVGGAQ